MSEETAPYGTGASSPADRAASPIKRVRTQHLRELKQRGERFAMLTAYDMYTAEIFDEAGVEVLLVGDSASNNVYGNETSPPVTVDELLPSREPSHARSPGRSWSGTCRSGPTSAPRSRPTTPPSGS